jgi:hypothetical protein
LKNEICCNISVLTEAWLQLVTYVFLSNFLFLLKFVLLVESLVCLGRIKFNSGYHTSNRRGEYWLGLQQWNNSHGNWYVFQVTALQMLEVILQFECTDFSNLVTFDFASVSIFMYWGYKITAPWRYVQESGKAACILSLITSYGWVCPMKICTGIRQSSMHP